MCGDGRNSLSGDLGGGNVDDGCNGNDTDGDQIGGASERMKS